jgi:hypothetical protein
LALAANPQTTIVNAKVNVLRCMTVGCSLFVPLD